MIDGRVYESITRLILEAAAEIEGHNEAFTQVVADKQSAEAELKRVRGLLTGSYSMIANWRAFLVELEKDRPGDIRFTRAFAGEHPLRPAAWEKK